MNTFAIDKILNIFISQVQLAEDNVILLFNGKKKLKYTSEQDPKNIEELKYLLEKIDSWTACPGGLDVKQYPKITPDCAFRDDYYRTWRHIKCEVILEQGIVCKYCCALDQRLSQFLNRSYMRRKRQNRINKALLHTIPDQMKSGVKCMKKQLKAQKKTINRRDSKILKLTQELNESFNQIQKMNKAPLSEMIAKMEMPENEVMEYY